VNSKITDAFRERFATLPDDVKDLARKAYRLWRDNPRHPSLRFKKVHQKEPVYSVRVSRGWRVLGKLRDDTMTWFWIGSHAEYDKILS